MSDIFKGLCQDVCSKKKFGLCDDKPNQRAYLSVDGGKWIAEIRNLHQLEITFTAIDNCIEFRTEENKMEDRCEGILTYDETIIFIEAKERKGRKAKDWIKGADEQLRMTITNVSSKINLDYFTNKQAAICNNLRTRNNQKHSARIKKFEEETGYTLIVKCFLDI